MKKTIVAILFLASAAACSPKKQGPLVLGDDGRVHPVKDDKKNPLPKFDDTQADCADDAREPDDSPADVASSDKIFSGPKPVTVDGGISCPGNEDFLHGYADANTDAGATVTWNGDEGDLRVDFLDATGEVVELDQPDDVAQRTPGKVVLSRHAFGGGDFYIRIRNRGGTRTAYTVVMRAITAP